jgi:hypothetical protein
MTSTGFSTMNRSLPCYLLEFVFLLLSSFFISFDSYVAYVPSQNGRTSFISLLLPTLRILFPYQNSTFHPFSLYFLLSFDDWNDKTAGRKIPAQTKPLSLHKSLL